MTDHTNNSRSEEGERRKLDKFHYALLTATLFMSQVPCDVSYDRKMAELLGEVKKAHDEQTATPTTEIIAELERLLVNIPSNTTKYAEKIHERLQELKAKETQL